ncbi:MAG: hypothetical protein CO113_01385 [Elusimicrobia bacterium CG_4_9_14_3_um_filter_62_55]|nr:MAG: hypothetical protein COR54_07620 [Elusimicrobia bacterium CG22_combo_CG10-13_8_21_14_all_63_91]PJA14600.1 MAG: hypothetical protein COX66_12230 [Elusimicrobia bacterium CG_4_10_14_0_2_um_filter_63_34]PJB26817.1 MAG: hypothetical protein CO113_01385 [Elusimicrobia bacterium CG_4_9_14_3_um_filter_62_55]
MISKSSWKSRRAPRRAEAGLFAAVAVTALLLLPLPPDRPQGERPAIQDIPFRPPTDPHSLFVYPKPGKPLPHFTLKIRPEFIRALNAAVPKGVRFSKVRYKKVPVESFAIDGNPVPGPNTARYRGYGHLHWAFRQKSIKVQTDKDRQVRGHRTLNLTALSTDPFFFEIWASEVLHRSGGVSSRVGLATVDLNGRYDGLRQVVENLDMDLLESQTLPKGAIYREREHAKIGREYLWAGEIRDLWKKNALQKADWSDLEDFNDSVRESVLNGGDAFLRRVNLGQFVNYYAALVIIGTVHCARS